MLIHEEVQLVLKDLSVPGPVHHFTRLEELQASPPPPAETAPDHHLGGCLTLFLVNLGSNRSVLLALLQQKLWYPSLSSKWLSSLNMTFFHSLTSQWAFCLANFTLPLFILSLIRGLSAIFLEGNCSLSWHVVGCPSSDSWQRWWDSSRPSLLILIMVPKETLGDLPDRPLFLANGSSGCFLAQDELFLRPLSLMPSCSLIVLRGKSTLHTSMTALLSSSEKGLMPFGKLAVHWDQCEKVPLLYSSAKQKVFVLIGDFSSRTSRRTPLSITTGIRGVAYFTKQ
jgi:hypothetical protein